LETEKKVSGNLPAQSPISEDETNARILVVDGHPEDRQLIARLVAQFPLSLSLVSLGSAIEAMDYLGANRRQLSRTPDLIIVDFDMPDLSGPRLLASLRRHEAFRSLPVVALTCSADPDNVRRAYDFGANAVINRSGPPETMGEIVRTLIDFWFRVADRYLID
jgi:CheY-like chemotaxis protein